MKNKERKIPRTGAYLLYVSFTTCSMCKKALQRYIMRKAPCRPTAVYLLYLRVEYKGLDKIRRSIVRFFTSLRAYLPSHHHNSQSSRVWIFGCALFPFSVFCFENFFELIAKRPAHHKTCQSPSRIDGTFRPKKNATRAESATMTVRLLKAQNGVSKNEINARDKQSRVKTVA